MEDIKKNIRHKKGDTAFIHCLRERVHDYFHENNLSTRADSRFFIKGNFLFLLSTYGHKGFESRVNKKGLYKIFNTSIHHYLHHAKVRCNYGIYLNFWDWISGTNDVQYKAKIEEFKEKLNPRYSWGFVAKVKRPIKTDIFGCFCTEM